MRRAWLPALALLAGCAPSPPEAQVPQVERGLVRVVNLLATPVKVLIDGRTAGEPEDDTALAAQRLRVGTPQVGADTGSGSASSAVPVQRGLETFVLVTGSTKAPTLVVTSRQPGQVPPENAELTVANLGRRPVALSLDERPPTAVGPGAWSSVAVPVGRHVLTASVDGAQVPAYVREFGDAETYLLAVEERSGRVLAHWVMTSSRHVVAVGTPTKN